ncbi:MAG: hypothetical protein U0229_14505 [Anaeromyxobacter sp.]
MPRHAALAAAFLALAGVACDPQADASSYRGEPLFEFDGTVVAATSAALPDVEIGVAWQGGAVPALASSVAAVERNPVSRSGATGDFTVRIYVPPPASAYLALAAGDPRVAVATLGAFPAGNASSQAAPPYPAGGFYSGYDLDTWVVHLAGDVPAGSATAWWLGGSAKAGFHLVHLTDAGCPTTDEVAACVAALTALGVSPFPSDGPVGASGGGGAEALCKARYRLSLAPASTTISFEIGAAAADPWACP